MSPIALVVLVMVVLNRGFALVLLAMSLWALFEAVRASNYAYQSAFKRTKGFWVAICAGCVLFSLLGVNGNINSLFLQLAVAVAAGVFLADVRPAVATRR